MGWRSCALSTALRNAGPLRTDRNSSPLRRSSHFLPGAWCTTACAKWCSAEHGLGRNMGRPLTVRAGIHPADVDAAEDEEDVVDEEDAGTTMSCLARYEAVSTVALGPRPVPFSPTDTASKRITHPHWGLHCWPHASRRRWAGVVGLEDDSEASTDETTAVDDVDGGRVGRPPRKRCWCSKNLMAAFQLLLSWLFPPKCTSAVCLGR